MSFVQPQTNATRHSVGIGIAVVFHIVLVWALMNGLAKKVVQAISAPIETKIIEEVKPPPPPPKVIDLPPPPKFTPPPPAFVPPPEVQVQAPPPPQATITTSSAEPPPVAAPVVAAPRAETPPAPAPAPARAVSASVACSNFSTVMGDAEFPREAMRLGLESGSAVVQFTLGPNGEVKDVQALRASHPVFAKSSIRLVGQYKCAGQGREVLVQVPFAYKSE
jgi:protein TonB